VNLTETMPFTAHRPGAVKSGTADARNGVPIARPSNSRTPRAAPPEGSVATSGDERPIPLGMEGSSVVAPQPEASIAPGERRPEPVSSGALAKQPPAPRAGSAARARWPSRLIVAGLASASLLAVFALLWFRRDRSLS